MSTPEPGDHVRRNKPMPVTQDEKRARVVSLVRDHLDDSEVDRIHKLLGGSKISTDRRVVTDRGGAKSFFERFPETAAVKTSLNGVSFT
jgi:hypothetical protein